IMKKNYCLPKMGDASKWAVRFVVLLVLTVFFTGCIIIPFKHERPLTPLIEGSIVDAISNSPITDAKVYLRPANGYQEQAFDRTLVEAVSPDGTFRINPIAEVGWWYSIVFLPMEGFCTVDLEVEHPHYESFKASVGYFGGAMIDSVCSGTRVAPIQVKLVPRVTE
ncbi:MAG: hypothetical protein KDD62_05965, partial [Bdellovibrionales bacterium]|nr:hypothetical protein [Bdellovibrionales bacterium]